jgi:hypothetical protein
MNAGRIAGVDYSLSSLQTKIRFATSFTMDDVVDDDDDDDVDDGGMMLAATPDH